jgi:hypothetical protein
VRNCASQYDDIVTPIHITFASFNFSKLSLKKLPQGVLNWPKVVLPPYILNNKIRKASCDFHQFS